MAEPHPDSLHAAQVQQKFSFYVVGLTFTVLGLSIQTATFSGIAAFRIAELVAWIAFLLSGFAGLSWLEYMPKGYQLSGLASDLADRRRSLETARVSGTQVVHVTNERTVKPIDELISVAVADVTTVEDRIRKLDRTAAMKYRVQRWSLVAGFCGLVIARGGMPLVELLRLLVK